MEQGYMPILLKAATTALEKDQVYRLRYKVFVEEERRFAHDLDRIFDFYDTLDENVNFIAKEDDKVVGSLRVTMDNPVGIPALDHYDFRPMMAETPGRFAGIGWLCISEKYRRHRGILPALFKMIVRETKNRGIEHLIAPLHPPILPLLERFGAQPVAPEFFSSELNVSMVPIHINYGELPPGLREFSQDPLRIPFDDSNERRIYRQGEEIVEKGAPGTEAFLIMRGSVEVVLRQDVNHRRRASDKSANESSESNPLLGPGHVFGEFSLLDGGPRTASVIGHSKEVDVMVWTREQLFEQLRTDQKKAFKLCKMLTRRFRMEIEGYQKDQSHESLVATIMMDASRKGAETVNLPWLARQCGFRGQEMKALMQRWAFDKMIEFINDGQTIQICEPSRLKEKMIWH